ncbi:MAG TPA: two-component system activity regulator YycH [Paenibacillus sp.]|uniref:YycH family regulatory protein n=1 Tax=Paenibacillus sp. TaxID=58172 RepID=UPI002B66A80D|nr:two-component system activity regulator YycH [Paenibacillus sp.]HUC93625.1 two-component system activity regulator YycH [Paenibacillus sp.]
MIERIKTGALVVLVMLSLLQSYLLAYSFPNLGATVTAEQEYIPTETMGQSQKIDQVLFPEDIVLHMGKDRHTVLYPDMTFYNNIYADIREGEYRSFQRTRVDRTNWNELRAQAAGVELRFGKGVPVTLLQRVVPRLEGDILFMGDSIERIWIMKRADNEAPKAYFFSTDGVTVYESSQSDLSAQRLQRQVGYGAYLPAYTLWRGSIYIPQQPVEAVEYRFGYASYSPEQMQRNLFFDQAKTRNLKDYDGNQIYTDGKRGLKLESNGTWMVYTDPVAMLDSPNSLADNTLAALQFVNQHGGWDGVHRFVGPGPESDNRSIVFQQYFGSYPLLDSPNLRYGQIQLELEQGVVRNYERSLLTRGERRGDSTVRWLPGGEGLRSALNQFARRGEIEAVFPALVVAQQHGDKGVEPALVMEPVWAVRLADGAQATIAQAWAAGFKPETEPVVQPPAGAGPDAPNGAGPGSGDIPPRTGGLQDPGFGSGSLLPDDGEPAEPAQPGDSAGGGG